MWNPDNIKSLVGFELEKSFDTKYENMGNEGFWGWKVNLNRKVNFEVDNGSFRL